MVVTGGDMHADATQTNLNSSGSLMKVRASSNKSAQGSLTSPMTNPHTPIDLCATTEQERATELIILLAFS